MVLKLIIRRRKTPLKIAVKIKITNCAVKTHNMKSKRIKKKVVGALQGMNGS